MYHIFSSPFQASLEKTVSRRNCIRFYWKVNVFIFTTKAISTGSMHQVYQYMYTLYIYAFIEYVMVGINIWRSDSISAMLGTFKAFKYV